jgi:hypothetical protein
VTALERARQSADSEIAARAGYNLGVVYRELGRSDDELAAYQRVIDDYGQDPAPALRERVALALVNKGVRLGGAWAVGRGHRGLPADDQRLRPRSRPCPARDCRPCA